MNIHTNIKEIIKKYGRGIINLIIAVGVSFILSARSLYFSTGQFGIEMFKSYFEYSRAVTPQIRQAGNRLSGLAETAYASLLA